MASSNTAWHPMKLVDGRYQKISLGRGAQRGRRPPAEGSARKSGPDSLFVIGSCQTTQQRAGLPAAQVRLLLGHQQLRPPGAHLPLHHRGGRGEHVGLRRDDELLQRHAERQGRCCSSARTRPRRTGVACCTSCTLQGKRRKMIVVDPRFTAPQPRPWYIRIRSGTDVPFLFGLLYHIFQNGWERQASTSGPRLRHGQDPRDVLAKLDARQGGRSLRCARHLQMLLATARTMAENRPAPSSGAWARPSTRSATRWCAPPASCSSRSATSGKSGGGANIFRGHDNVQGRDRRRLTPIPCRLLRPRHRLVNLGGTCEAWTTGSGSKGRYVSQELMEVRHHRVALDRRRAREQGPHRPAAGNLRAVVYWVMRPTRRRAAPRWSNDEKLDALVVIDPYPSATAAMAAMVRKDGVHTCRPAPSSRPTARRPRRTARSSGARGHRAPLRGQARPHHHVRLREEVRLGRAVREKNIKLEGCPGLGRAEHRDTLREINRGTWTIGYTGQSPERLKLRMKNMHTFDVRTLKAVGGPATASTSACRGRVTARRDEAPRHAQPLRHLQTRDGRRWQFRANFGVERTVCRCSPARAPASKAPTCRWATRVRPRAVGRNWAGGTRLTDAEGRGRGQELEDRPLGRDHPRGWP